MTIDFKPTWLYLKQHNLTGLLYFGKTIKDPFAYPGSGIHWTSHLKKHGDNVTTIWTKLFTDKEELSHYALQYSHNNNIVESAAYANLMLENGLTGGDTGISQQGREQLRIKSSLHKHSLKTIQKIKEARARQKPTMLGKTHSEETKQKIRQYNLNKPRTSPLVKIKNLKPHNHSGELNPMFGKTHSIDTKEKISASLKGRVMSGEWKEKAATARIGSVWWHNNFIETRSKVSPNDTWVRGRLPNNKNKGN